MKKNVFSAVLNHCPRMESCKRSSANGSMLPDLQWWIHVRQTLSSSAELQADDRVQPSTQELVQRSDKYAGASPCIALYIIRQFELDVLCHRQPMQPIMNQASMQVFSCTAKHPCRSIHHTLQTIKRIVRWSSEKAVTVVNPADYKAVD